MAPPNVISPIVSDSFRGVHIALCGAGGGHRLTVGKNARNRTSCVESLLPILLRSTTATLAEALAAGAGWCGSPPATHCYPPAFEKKRRLRHPGSGLRSFGDHPQSISRMGSSFAFV